MPILKNIKSIDAAAEAGEMMKHVCCYDLAQKHS